MDYDQIAHDAGLLTGISGELWMKDISKSSAVFVEKISEYYDCYRLTWYKQREDGSRKIASERFYVRNGDFDKAVEKAKSLIEWFEKLNKAKG